MVRPDAFAEDRTMLRLLLIICGLLMAPLAEVASAQSQFAPAIQVGNRVITRYQIDQRTQFLTILGAPGDVRTVAEEQLTNEAVQLNAADAAGLEVAPAQVEAGMAEFAARGNLEVERVIEILGQAGIEEETFRSFILAGVAWRSLVQRRFSEPARASIPDGLSARRLARTGPQGGTRVLVSEILLPANTPENALASRARAAEISSLRNEEDFVAAARRFSVSSSSSFGGALNWTALDGLPPDVRSVIGALNPGEISRPVELENAVAVFLLRDLERVQSGSSEAILTEYALFTVGADRARAVRVAAEVDVCDDLYGQAVGLPENRLIRETKPTNELPTDLRSELARLDENETSTAIVRGGNATVLMLCERRPDQENTVDLNIIGNQLLDARISTSALHFLTELRASTIVIDLTN